MNKFITILVLGFALIAAGLPSFIEKQYQPENGFANPGFEQNLYGVCKGQASSGAGATPFDSLGTWPQDCSTSGNATTTVTQTSTTPVRGNRSLLISKPDSDRQRDFTFLESIRLEDAQLSKPLELSFEYAATEDFAFSNDNCATPSDVEVWILSYDTLGLDDELNRAQVTCLDGSGDYVTPFISNKRFHRVMLYIPTVNPDAWGLRVDTLKLSKAKGQFIPFVSDWQSYTPTFTGFGTVSNVSAKWRQDGPDLLLDVKVQSGTSTGTEARMSLPSGLISSSSISVIQTAGWISYNNNSDRQKNALIEPNVSYLTFGSQGTAVQGLVKMNGNSFIDNNSTISFTARVPIQGWTSGAKTQGQILQNVPSHFLAYKSSNQSITSGSDQKLTFQTVHADSSGGWDSSNNRYIFRQPGYYKIFGGAGTSTVPSAGTQYLFFKINGTTNVGITQFYAQNASGISQQTSTPTMWFNAGEYIEFYIYTSSNFDILASNGNTFFNVEKQTDASTYRQINRTTTKYLASNVTSNTNPITSWALNNLIVGKRYRIIITPRVDFNAAGSVLIYGIHSGSNVAEFFLQAANGTALKFSSVSPIFTATATTVSFSVAFTGTMGLLGNGTSLSNIEIIEENNTVPGNF